MLKSGLIEAFKTFTPQEMKEFSEFVSSPYFNKNVNVISLFEVIRKNYPEFDADKIEKEKVFKKVYPGKPYKDSTMRLLMYYLFEVVEKFLAYTCFTKNGFAVRENMIKEFRNRGLNKEFEKNIEEAAKEVEKIPEKEESFYMNRFIFKYEHLGYVSSGAPQKIEKALHIDDIEFASNNLTYYYLIRILKFYSVILNTMYLYNVKIDLSLFESVMKNFDEGLYKDIPLIGIYYYVVMVLLNPEEEKYYYKLKELILKNENILSHDTLSDLYINLENYCHRRARAGETKFYAESLDIYNHELNKEICFTDGIIANSFFISYVVSACRIKDFESASKFIESYTKTLKEDSREAFYHYGNAFMECDLKRYEKSLEHLAKVKPEELYLKMDVRLLQCRIYYELGWSMPLQSLLDTFRKTVQNNKLMTETRRGHFISFIKFLNQLNNMKYKEDLNGINNLRETLKKEEQFPYRLWLIEKIDELLNKDMP